MNLGLILSIILIEGFVTISIEVLTIRQLIPEVGSSVVVTSLIIGFFLLFLALGYRRGGDYTGAYRRILKRNFTLTTFLCGVGLSYLFILLLFHFAKFYLHFNTIATLIFYLLFVISPIVYLLGQTVPIATNLIQNETHIGTISGKVLFVSTLGSFLGAVLTSLILMTFLGVAWTVFFNYVLLTILVVLLFEGAVEDWVRLTGLLLLGIFIYGLNVGYEENAFIKTNTYGNYAVRQAVKFPQLQPGKLLLINKTWSSFINQNKKALPYVELMKRILFHDLKLKNKNILVLGAGGFTLSAENTFGNHFTYNDIDKDVVQIAKNHFVGKIKGTFMADDARTFLTKNQKPFDVIVSDTYSNYTSMPFYLLTQAHFANIKRKLTMGGYAVFNIIAKPTLSDPYSKRVDNTIRSVFHNCMVMPARYTDTLQNIIYVCKKTGNENDGTVYTDNQNTATLDAFR